jgi:thiamine-phosphate pyrophosphorylase
VTTAPAAARLRRLIDANLNRLKEGLRVLEDIQRYLYDDGESSRRFKRLRHSLQKAYDPSRLPYRDIVNDVLKESTASEMKRSNLTDLLLANFSRAQESARVLEEVFKLEDPQLSPLFKTIRYVLYDLEKSLLGSPAAKSSSNSR